MKKKLTLIITLLLVAACLAACSLTELTRMITSKSVQQNAPEDTYILDGDEYDSEVAMEEAIPMYGMPMATAMPAMGYMAAYAPMPEMNTEEYASIVENGFTSVRTSPLSTFSADVDTASYCNLRRMLNDGWSPSGIPSGAVRVEEMLNYFRYDYDAPTGDDRFGVTATIADCPWNKDHKLLMLGIRAADAPEAAEAGSNLVFLIDVSGSMYDYNKLPLAKQSMVMLLDELGENDTVSIVTYASGERIVIEGANPVRDKAKLMAAIDSLQADGSTNGQRGLAQAYEVAQRHFRRGGNNRVIMCSDGDLNVGITSESDLHDYVSKQKETGIYLSVLGFGDGNYKDTKMETLADDGNGNYYYIDSILEARKVLCEELTQTIYTVADDVKFQIEFNPGKVSAYRQIGYENRALSDADFTDDKKDAGEVGAGATVTVLYELVPAGTPGETESTLKYQDTALTEAGQGDEWLTVSLRSKAPGGDKSELQTRAVGEESLTDEPSGDFLYAAAVAEFGMLLTDSEYKGDTSYESILDLLKRSPLDDDYREEFFSLVKIAQRASRLDQ